MSDDTMTADVSNRDAEVRRLARVLDDAWERMIEQYGMGEATDANRTRLAARIVWLSQQGERDERALSDAATIYLCALVAAGKLRRDTTEAVGFQAKPFRRDMGRAYDAQAVAAMEEALALCREALPDPVSSTVMSFLSRTILDHAAQGERNAVRLCNRALEALQSRR